MQKRMFIFSLLAILLVSCSGVSSSNQTTSSSSDSSSNTTTSATSTVDEQAVLTNVLSQLQADEFGFRGEFTISFYNSETGLPINSASNDLTIVMSDEAFYLEYQDTQEWTVVSIFKDEDGNAITKQLMPDNTISSVPFVDNNNEPIPFTSYSYNPFESITIDNLTLDNNVVTFVDLTDEQKSEIAYLYTTYTDIPYQELLLSVDEEGTILQGQFLGSDENIDVPISETETLTVNMEAVLDFTLQGFENTYFNDPEPLPHLEEHDKLDDLFERMNNKNYTLEVTKKGGLVADSVTKETWIVTDDLFLRISHFDNGDSGIGLYKTEDQGLANVTYNGDGKLYGNGTFNNENTIADYTLGYQFASEVFDVNEDGSFTLKEDYGFESYIQYTAPDFAYNFSSYLYYLVPGTYSITVHDDGTATFAYDYAYIYYGQTVEGTISIEVTNINTTTYDYEYVPYTEPDYTSWDDYGEGTLDLIKTYLGDNAETLLPVINIDTIRTYTAFENRSYQGNDYGFFMAAYTTPTDAAAAFEEYESLLLELGWIKDDVETNGYYHINETGDGYYHIKVWVVSSYLYINLNQPSKTLTEWFNGEFATSNNATLTYTTTVNTYAYDSATSQKGELISSEETYKKTEKNNDVALEQNDDGSIMYFNENSSANLFEIISQRSDGTYALLTSYPLGGDGYTLETYVGFYLLPSMLKDYLVIFNPVEGEDGMYVINDSLGYTPQVIAGFLGFTVSAEATLQVKIDFYNNKITFEFIDVSIEGDTYVETINKLEISNIGNTRVTVPEITE